MTAEEMFALAQQYEEKEDPEMAYQWYLEAALTFEDGSSIGALGRMYFQGEYVDESYGKACHYWEIAHEKGTVLPRECYIYMGDCRQYGRDGVVKDTQLAVKWFLMAASKGDDFGYECAACIYFYGDGSVKDYEKAFELFNKPKKQNSCALYHLGVMYENGYGVAKDQTKAMNYYKKAAVYFDEMGLDVEDDYSEKAKERLADQSHPLQQGG